MAAMTPKPNILWRLFVLGGLGTATVVSIDDRAWEAFDEATGNTVSRDAVRTMVASTAGLHVLEAAAAHRSARRAGLERPWRWSFATLIYGFPVLFRLRRARRAQAA